MPKVALGITLVLLLVTCYFSFASKGKIEGLHQDILKLTSDLNLTKQQLAKSQADLKASQDEVAKAKTEIDSLNTQLTSAKADLDKANAQVTTLTASNADLTKQVEDLKAKAASSNPGTPTNQPAAADVDKLNAQLKEATAQVAELTQLKETLTAKAKDAESRANDLEKQVNRYKGHILQNGLEGEVLAVNPGWNFVVLSIGDRQGAVTNGEMILERGGQKIGKVKITSVDPSTSVADIVPGSLARGVRVQAGDRVIFTGN